MQGEITGGFLSKNYSKHNFPISACKTHWSKDNGWTSGFCPLLALQENDVVQGGPTDFELPCGEEMISRKFQSYTRIYTYTIYAVEGFKWKKGIRK